VTGAAGNLGSLVLAANGSYTYTVANGAVQFLGAGDTRVDSFTVTSFDGTASQLVSVTIHGTNDVPVIGGIATGSVTEDVAVDISGNLSTGGALTIADVDQGQSSFVPQAGAAGTYGTFTLDAAGNWSYTASDRAAFLLPVRVLGKLSRRLFLAPLTELHHAGRLAFFGAHADLTDRHRFLRPLAPVRKKRWVVYAKPPFAGPEAVLAYLARYTHRVAISNRRLIAFDKAGVTFRYKDYRRNGPEHHQVMTLDTHEFMRRLLLHVLPRGSTACGITDCSPAPPARPTLSAPASCWMCCHHRNRPNRWNCPVRARLVPVAAGARASSRSSDAGANHVRRPEPRRQPDDAVVTRSAAFSRHRAIATLADPTRVLHS
jgi:VCBS repeat-containing protein